MSATRVNFAVGTVMVLLCIWNGRMKASRRALFALLIVGITLVALRNERFQRFKSLSDSENVEERISGSVNRSFFEVFFVYPLGNGLGGGGTNIPVFLQGQVRNPIAMENEYARILLEQGVIGFLLWMGFIIWFLSRYKIAFAAGPWATARRMVWLSCVIGFVTSAIGTGMLTAIPDTAIFLLGIGFSSSPLRSEAAESRRVGEAGVRVPPRAFRLAPSV